MNNKPQIFFMVALTIVFVLSILVLSPFIITIVLAIVAAILLNPVYKRLTKLCWKNKTLGSILTVLLFYIVILLPISLISFQLFKEVQTVYTTFSMSDAPTLSSLNQSLNKLIQPINPSANIHLENYIGAVSSWFISHIGAIFSVTFDFFLKVLLATIAMFFLLRDGDKFKTIIKDLNPISSEAHDYLVSSIRTSVNSVVLGSIVIALIQGIVAGIGMAIFGIPNATLWGTATVIASFIPGIGTGLILGPAILYSLFFNSMFQTIGLLLWALIIVNAIDNFLRPAIMHKTINMHPLFILFSILGGISFIGPSGFILGPLILSLLFAMIRVYKLKEISIS